jgi:hypothetical protein
VLRGQRAGHLGCSIPARRGIASAWVRRPSADVAQRQLLWRAGLNLLRPLDYRPLWYASTFAVRSLLNGLRLPSMPRSQGGATRRLPLPPSGRTHMVVDTVSRMALNGKVFLSRLDARGLPIQTRCRAVRQIQGDPVRIYPLGVRRSITSPQRRQIGIGLAVHDVVVVDHDPGRLVGPCRQCPLGAMPHRSDARASLQRPSGYLSATSR